MSAPLDPPPAAAAGSSTQLYDLFEQAPVFLCFLRGPQLVFEYSNPAYLRLVGHRPILGKTIREALPELAGQGFYELLEEVLRSGTPFVGNEMRAMLQHEPGGPVTEAWVNFVYQPIRAAAGEVTGILVSGADVTEAVAQRASRTAAERALSRSQALYRALFESIDDGFCIMEMIVDATGKTVDYRFLEANAAFERQSGLVDAVGKTALELVPDLDPSWFRLYGEVAESGVTKRFENHAPAMNRWFEVYASRVGAPASRHVALMFKDITERKRSDAERETLLERESAARQEAEEASRLKDEFLTTLSHELRTPLNAVMGWLQMIRSGRLPQERHAAALATVERNAHAQAALIDDLLDMSRILAGKMRLDVAPVDMAGVVEAAVETVRPAAEARSIRLRSVLASSCRVMGDAQRLQQVIWNLLANAVKFTPKGGQVQVVLACLDSAAEVSVSDTGQGIAADLLPLVFDRFRQADGGTTRRQGGLGLGLSIVRQLVEMHGGTVEAMSDGPDRGATFIVRVPLAIAQQRDSPTSLRLASSSADAPAVPAPSLDGLSVLVVDDSDDARELLREQLQGSGARVRVARSCAEALLAFGVEAPDVLVSDIGMPEEDGYALISQVRALPLELGGGVPAIALTAYARSGDRTRALSAGFGHHLAKPVDPHELLATIAAAVRRHPRG